MLSQSSLSVGSDLDLTDTPSPAYPLRRSWDANQEGTGLEVNGSLSGNGCSSLRGFCCVLIGPLSVFMLPLTPPSPLCVSRC